MPRAQLEPATNQAGKAACCPLCAKNVDQQDEYIQGSCSKCGLASYHVDCVVDFLTSRSTKKHGAWTSSTATMKAFEIKARKSPAHQFGRVGGACPVSACQGRIVDADTVKPAKQVPALPVLPRREPRAQKPAAAGIAGKERSVKGQEARKAAPANTPPVRPAPAAAASGRTSAGTKQQPEPQQSQRLQRERQGVRLVVAALAAACEGQNSAGSLPGSPASRSQPTFAEEQTLEQQKEDCRQQRSQRQGQHSKAVVQAPHPWQRQGMHSDNMEKPPALTRLGMAGERADSRSRLASQPASEAEQETLVGGEEWPSLGASGGGKKSFTSGKTLLPGDDDKDTNSGSIESSGSGSIGGETRSDPWAGLIAQARCGTFSGPAKAAAQAAPPAGRIMSPPGLSLPGHGECSTVWGAATPGLQQTASHASQTSHAGSTRELLAPVIPVTPAPLTMEVPAPHTTYTTKLASDARPPAPSTVLVTASSKSSLVAWAAEGDAHAGPTRVEAVADPFSAGYQAGLAAAMAQLGVLEGGSIAGTRPEPAAAFGWGAGGGLPQCRGQLLAEEENAQEELENMLAMLGCSFA